MSLIIHSLVFSYCYTFIFFIFFFFFNDTATTEIYTLFLHDALPISEAEHCNCSIGFLRPCSAPRSEEHTSELQSRENLVCRLLLEKKKKKTNKIPARTKKKNHTSERTTKSEQ